MVDWPEDEVLAHWYHEEGLTYRDIARRLDCAKSSVGNRIRAMNGVEPRPPRLQ